MDRQTRRRFWILASLLLVFGAVFVMRGPLRAIDGGADLAHLYAAAALWVEGGDPYDGAQCVERMQQAGYDQPERVKNGSFYPPPTIAALSPLGLVGWETARLVWLVLNLAGCGVLVWSLSNWLELEDARERWMLAVLMVVAWGAVATTLSLGQLSLMTAASVFSGLILLDRGRTWQAGLLIGLGCLIKPQLGLGFLVLIALRRDWRAMLTGVVLIAVVSAIGVGRLMVTAPDWAQQLASNIASDQASGKVLDAGGPMRFQMIDLQPLLHMVLPGAWVGRSALLIASMLAALAVFRLLRMGIRRHTLLAVSGVGLLSLMPVYHRYYDAVLLLPLLVLIFNTLARDRRDVLMWVIALMMAVLVFPLPALLATIQSKGITPESISDAWLWDHLVLQCQSWSLLIMAFALVAWTWLLAGDGRPQRAVNVAHKGGAES